MLYSRRDVLPFTINHINWLSVCPLQTIRGTDELPVKVRRASEAVGWPAVARAMRAALGDAVQQLRWRLPPQPIGHTTEHHRATVDGTLAPESSQAPAAADCRDPTG